MLVQETKLHRLAVSTMYKYQKNTFIKGYNVMLRVNNGMDKECEIFTEIGLKEKWILMQDFWPGFTIY